MNALRSTADQLAGSVITPRPAPIFGMYAGRQSVNTAKGASMDPQKFGDSYDFVKSAPRQLVLPAHCLT